MKAVIWTAYGPPEVLKVQEIEKPVPKDNEILVKVFAANVTAGDCEQRALKLSLLLKIAVRFYIGLLRPSRIKILGLDLSGTVESTGAKVTVFKPGDNIFATTGFVAMGAYAEYICLPVDDADCAVALKPENMSWEEAAGVPTGALEALHFLKKVPDLSGLKTLIIGGGGTIGTFAVQLAKSMGAEVTATDSTDKLHLLTDLGADKVIDFTAEDFTRQGIKYDVIFDIAGRSSLTKNLRSLKPDGYYLRANPGFPDSLLGKLIPAFSKKQVVVGGSVQRTEDLEYLAQLINDGKLVSAIDKTFPMEQAAEAHRYVESGKKKGNVVLNIAATPTE